MVAWDSGGGVGLGWWRGTRMGRTDSDGALPGEGADGLARGCGAAAGRAGRKTRTAPLRGPSAARSKGLEPLTF